MQKPCRKHRSAPAPSLSPSFGPPCLEPLQGDERTSSKPKGMRRQPPVNRAGIRGAMLRRDAGLAAQEAKGTPSPPGVTTRGVTSPAGPGLLTSGSREQPSEPSSTQHPVCSLTQGFSPCSRSPLPPTRETDHFSPSIAKVAIPLQKSCFRMSLAPSLRLDFSGIYQICLFSKLFPPPL